MSARDIFHDAVKHALEKDGWTITHDPLLLEFGGVEMQVDLGAEKLLAAEKAGRKIAVEVKSFVGPSNISEFHTALGQFMNYRVAIEEERLDYILYLAVPIETYKKFFTLEFTQIVIRRYQLKLLVYDAESEVIVQWHE
jgi:hypothetical protein